MVEVTKEWKFPCTVCLQRECGKEFYSLPVLGFSVYERCSGIKDKLKTRASFYAKYKQINKWG